MLCIVNFLITALWLQPEPPFPAQDSTASVGATLSVQTYSFQKYSLSEAMSMAKEAGFHSIEVFDNQDLFTNESGKFHFTMSAEEKERIKFLLREHDLELQAYGVVHARSEGEWRELFTFAAELGIPYLIVEPDAKFMPLIGVLASESGIHVGIHNHPKPSRYWHPEEIVEALELAASPFVGACADVGHWFRSGLDPVDCLRQLSGRVNSLHLKDLTRVGSEFEHRVIGEGEIDFNAIVLELVEQGFRGNFSVEYEAQWEDNAEQIARSLGNFRGILSVNGLISR